MIDSDASLWQKFKKICHELKEVIQSLRCRSNPKFNHVHNRHFFLFDSFFCANLTYFTTWIIECDVHLAAFRQIYKRSSVYFDEFSIKRKMNVDVMTRQQIDHRKIHKSKFNWAQMLVIDELKKKLIFLSWCECVKRLRIKWKKSCHLYLLLFEFEEHESVLRRNINIRKSFCIFIIIFRILRLRIAVLCQLTKWNLSFLSWK